MEYLGLHNKPKAEVHPGQKLMGPKEGGGGGGGGGDEEEEEEEEEFYSLVKNRVSCPSNLFLIFFINKALY
jgi:hypothetical protein